MPSFNFLSQLQYNKIAIIYSFNEIYCVSRLYAIMSLIHSRLSFFFLYFFLLSLCLFPVICVFILVISVHALFLWCSSGFKSFLILLNSIQKPYETQFETLLGLFSYTPLAPLYFGTIGTNGKQWERERDWTERKKYINRTRILISQTKATQLKKKDVEK